jgi:PAS domain S-box-containing protein
MEGQDSSLSQKDNAQMADIFEKYQLAVESTPNAIIIANDKGKIVLVNQQAEKLFGYDRSELMGELLEILLPERYRAAHPGQRGSFMAAPSARPMGMGRDLYALRKDGTEIPVEIGLNPVKTEEGHFVLAAIADITLRKQAEETLRKSQERFRHMVENLRAGAVHVEENAILFNKAAEEITGYSNSEISNLDDWFKKLYGKEHEKIRAQYENDKAAGFPVPRTVMLKRKDGEERFVQFAAYKDEKAEVWMLHDITERKRLEKMILEVTKKEQRRIGEELHEGLAQHLTLTAIAGKILGKKLSKKSPSLAREASKVTGMVNQAITQTRELAQGLYSLEMQSDGFPDALKKFASDTQKTCGVRCFFRSDPAVNVTDNTAAAHLYRIVREAVSNAVKHGRSKEIIISLKSKDSGTAELKITNSGAKFKARKPGYEGMGLKIMQSRAKLIGATLHIGPRPKGGTIVTCTFPNR